MAEQTTTPTLPPPVTGGAGAGGDTAPTLTAPPPATGDGGAVAERAEPQLQPGTDGAAAAALGITGTWTTGATVDALWAVNEIRNAFMHVASVGWKKIYNGGDGAFMALTTLASQARQTGRTISYREESDGMVHEIYLW